MSVNQVSGPLTMDDCGRTVLVRFPCDRWLAVELVCIDNRPDSLELGFLQHFGIVRRLSEFSEWRFAKATSKHRENGNVQD